MRTIARLIALLAVMAVLAPVQALLLATTRGPASTRFPMLVHGVLCRLLGLRVEVRGQPVGSPRAVYLSNHLSYLDVPALGSFLRCRFVAKEEVNGWPMFGWLSRLQRTVFVSRNPRRAAEVSRAIATAVSSGHRLVLFPEGTTSDGSRVLPFKSSLFAVLADPGLAPLELQPVSIELLEVDGRKVRTGGDRDLYAYHGEMQLLPHLFAFMGGTGARVRISFHAPLQDFTGCSRKELAALAHASVNACRGLDAFADEGSPA